MKLLVGGILLATAFAVFPLITQRRDLLNLGIQIFLAVALAQSWNLLGGCAGQSLPRPCTFSLASGRWLRRCSG
jgi:ABC-type branched-subunit amino acid transport system permease subunit